MCQETPQTSITNQDLEVSEATSSSTLSLEWHSIVALIMAVQQHALNSRALGAGIYHSDCQAAHSSRVQDTPVIT